MNERIFKEYQTNEKQVGLTQKEFSKFAECILALYEKQQKETLDIGRIGDWFVSYHLGKGLKLNFNFL
jgi:hypothetical protein